MNNTETSHWIWTFIDLPQADGDSSAQLLGKPI